MKLAISNIAWNHWEDPAIVLLFKKHAISGVEIAPTKIWQDPTVVHISAIKSYRKFWEDEGIPIVATQSLLFGHPELNIFKSASVRIQTLKYLEKIIRVSAQLGAQVMVFGSPKNRDTGEIDMKLALEIATEFFYKIGEIAKKHTIFFCIEPNPKIYGTNFINNTKEAILLLKQVNHPYFRLHLDSGTMTVNKERYQPSLRKGFPYLKHFHISEENLTPISNNIVDHTTLANILKTMHYDRWVSIEMRGKNNQSNKKMVDKVLKYVSAVYA